MNKKKETTEERLQKYYINNYKPNDPKQDIIYFVLFRQMLKSPNTNNIMVEFMKLRNMIIKQYNHISKMEIYNNKFNNIDIIMDELCIYTDLLIFFTGTFAIIQIKNLLISKCIPLDTEKIIKDFAVDLIPSYNNINIKKFSKIIMKCLIKTSNENIERQCRILLSFYGVYPVDNLREIIWNK
jgi:hypothetical protein